MPIRYTSSATFLEYPVIAIAIGPDPANHEARGHARGVIAIGDMASGIIALGAFSRGLVAIGGLAIGGLAIGYYALGGAAIGKFVIAPLHRDPEALEFFTRLLHGIVVLPKAPPR